MAAAAAERGGASRSRTAGPSRAQIMVTDLKSYMTCHSLRLAFGKIKHSRHDDPQLQSLVGFALWSRCRRTFEDAHSGLCTHSHLANIIDIATSTEYQCQHCHRPTHTGCSVFRLKTQCYPLYAPYYRAYGVYSPSFSSRAQTHHQ